MPGWQSILKQAAVTLVVLAVVSAVAKRVPAVNNLVNGAPVA